jgi:RNA polymerase sigma factor (TIGR02999 family)
MPNDRLESLAGDSDEMLALVYEELRQLAAARLAREGPGITLQPTALVHEAYMRLVGHDVRWDGRGHFFGAAALAMQRIMVEHARRRASLRRGGDRARVDAESDDFDAPIMPGVSPDQILAVNASLERMEARDERMAEVVRLRFFAGLTIDQTAAAMGVSDRTVRREWTFAKAWLSRELGRELGGDTEWTTDGDA